MGRIVGLASKMSACLISVTSAAILPTMTRNAHCGLNGRDH